MVLTGKIILEVLMKSGNYLAVVKTLLEPLLADCREKWKSHIENNFSSKGGEVGGWDATADSTKQLREALGYPPEPVMQMRGALRKSYRVESSSWLPRATMELFWGERGQGGSVRTWDGQSLSKLQHYGGKGYNPLTKKSFNVPSRPLYNHATLERIFVDTVEEPFKKLIANYALKMMGGGQ